jgi:phage anti-repressor protein
MSDLIPFMTRRLGTDTVNTVNARDLYAYLDLTKPYATWIKTQLRRAHLIENRDYVVFSLEGKNPQGGRPASEHHLTFDAAKHVAMMSSATKGHEVRTWFIEKEKELTSTQGAHPKVRDPAIQMLIDMAVQLDEARTLAAEAKQMAVVAETKADLALEDAHTMTLEGYITKNGLLRQFPRGQWTRYAKWLANFCLAMGLHVHKVSVYGKAWGEENAYPLAALHAWERQEIYQPRQVRLLRPDDTEGGAHA